LLLYIKLHNISETTFFSETLCGGAVWQWKSLNKYNWKMWVKPLSKFYDLTDRFTCQYMTQAVYLLTATYYKIDQQDSFKVITIGTALFQCGK
jgi:hypothetical protein